MVRKLLAALALLGSFAYGYLAHRQRLFPAPLIERWSAPPSRPAARPLVWQPARRDEASLAERREDAEAIESLPYLQGYQPAPQGRSVIRHDAESAFPGVNLYNSGHAPEAFLIDMKGGELHRWRLSFQETFPGRAIPEENRERASFWRRVVLLPDGGLLVIFERLGIARLDKDSRLRWAVPGGFHHHAAVAEDGRVYALEGVSRRLPRLAREAEVVEDFVTVLGEEGRVEERISLLRCFERSDYAPLLAEMKTEGDLFHTNFIQILDGAQQDRSPVFRKGNLIVSLLALDTVAVVDLEQKRAVWALAGLWDAQHEPVLLPSGRLLVFDNLGPRHGSRVLELDPFSQQIAWSYSGDAQTPLASWKAGTNQRLPNGNTLITESTAGRAIEVTPDRRVVWEFLNPFRAGDRQELIATLFEVRRFGPRELGWMPTVLK